MVHRKRRRAGGSLVALCLFAGQVSLLVRDSQAQPSAMPEEARGGPVAAPADDSAGHFLVLPYRSPARARSFLDAAILRYVCPRGYLALDGANKVPCRQSAALGEGGSLWRFVKSGGVAGLKSLDLMLIPSPGGGYELHVMGTVSGADGKKLNADLSGLKKDLEAFLEGLKSAPLGVPGDQLFAYQLSYVQADRAVAVLKTLGYPVVEYKKDADAAHQPVETVFDTIFTEIPSNASLSRPAIIRLIDSEPTSLVRDQASFGGGGTGSELTGGQKLVGISDSAPQQRLLIVFDEHDRASLDTLLARLQRDIDVPARQILIEALVIELDRDRLLDLGVDFKGRKDGSEFSFTESGGLVQPFLFSFERPYPKTLFEFMAKLRALVDLGQATVLSRPSVFVLDGRQARIQVGDDIPFTSELDISNGVVVSKNTYLKTGIILNLRPRAASDNSDVTLQVETIISSPGPSRVLPDLGILIAPPIQSRQVQTIVRVANDTPFVIGGLIAQTDQTNTIGIPWLSTIPILGRLFRKENVVNDRKEVIVVITPHIVAADDPTFSYTIPRDATSAGTGYGRSRPVGSARLHGDGAERCQLSRKDPIFEPRAPSEQIDQESIFDSFDSELFRNVYRLRSSDIFDLTFITESPEVRTAVLEVQNLTGKLTSAKFTGRPPIDPAEFEKEVARRLREELCPSEQVDCLGQEQESTFLTLFDGGAPGEEILVHHMMIRIIERLGFSACVPPENVIFFPREQSHGLDPRFLTRDEFIRSCLESEKTLIMAFPPKASSHEFLEKCLQQEDEGAAPIISSLGAFSPPSVQLTCSFVEDAKYIDRLRACNRRKEDGTWEWQAILLNRTFDQRRDRNTLALLQSVLALERLLDLNDSGTFPRTLDSFHVGRELVFPTREGLQTRRHLIDRGTAQLFYETLDYYYSFLKAYEQKTTSLSQSKEKLRQKYSAAQ